MKAITIKLLFSYLLIFVSVAAAQTLEQGLNSLAKQIGSGMTGGNKQKIAVIEFTNLDGKVSQLEKFVSEELITRLFMTKKFNVVERQLLDKITEEYKLSLSGLIDEATAQQLGKLLGVEAICSGTITDLGTAVKINARLISAETGSIFAVASAEITKDETVKTLMSHVDIPQKSTEKTSAGPVHQDTPANLLAAYEFNESSLAGWVPLAGDWLVVDGKLAQNSYSKPAFILAGDADWSRYQLEVDAQKIDGIEGFLIAFHAKDTRNALVWNIGGWGNTTSIIQRYSDLIHDQMWRLEPTAGSIRITEGLWYHIKIVVRDAHVQCFLNDALIIDHSDPDIQKLPAGKIGLGTFGTRAYFDNIRIIKTE
jgi:TolB-like protein